MQPRPSLPALQPLLLAALLACVCVRPALAQWSSDPSQNLAVCTAGGQQTLPQIVSDGGSPAGGRPGTIIVWYDGRPGAPGIYAQRLDPSGFAQWTANGVAVTTAAAAWNPAIASDGASGVIVAWTDYRSGSSYGIFAQRIGHDGSPLWGPNGVAVSTLPVGPSAPVIVTADGAGGAVVTWGGGYPYSAARVYVQRLDAAGSRMWPSGEVPVGEGNGLGSVPQVATDGGGGVIIAYLDFRSAGYELYAQRVGGTGERLWGPNDVQVCAVDTPVRFRPGIASDASGGALVSWIDSRYVNGQPQRRLFMQRLNASGSQQWAIAGVQVSQGTAAISDTLRADGHGGAFAAWYEAGGVRVQHVDAGGTPRWTPGGLLVGSTYAMTSYTLAADADGGLFVCLPTYSAYPNLWMHSIGPAGNLRWGPTGVPVSTANVGQFWPALLADGWAPTGAPAEGRSGSGATVAWADMRGGLSTDLYAQHLNAAGTLDAGAPSAPAALSLSAGPSPARAGDAVTLRFALPAAGPARVALHDLAGRRVRVLADGPYEAGTQAVRWDGRDASGRRAAPGVYFATLETGAGVRSARLVLLK
jgi:hypothetical protein